MSDFLKLRFFFPIYSFVLRVGSFETILKGPIRDSGFLGSLETCLVWNFTFWRILSLDSSRKKSFAHLIVPFKHRNVQSLVLVSNGLYNFSVTSYMYPEVISSFIYVCIFSYFLSCLPFISTSMLLAETFEELFCHLGRGRQRTNFNEVIPMWLCSLVSLLQTIFFTPPSFHSPL